MGYRGWSGRRKMVDRLKIDNQRQQLLAIWNRAKGKERDALLWGDEVTLLDAYLRIYIKLRFGWSGRISRRCI